MKTDYAIIEQELQDLKVDGFIDYWKELGDGHYRINEGLDLYPHSHKFHSLRTGKRGKYWNLKDFVIGFFNPELREGNKPKIYL